MNTESIMTAGAAAVKGTTEIYYADVAPLKDAELFDTVYRSVSEERRKKTDRMRFLKDKCLSLGAEYLLMHACSDFGVDYEREALTIGEHKKPDFTHSPLHFNLSHSGERVMCIMSQYTAGCDVETVKPIDLKIAERFFFENEYKLIEACGSQSEREDMFFRLWTLKESFMKCTGLGFALPLSEFSICIDGNGINVKQPVDDACYSLFEGPASDGYRYAWCVRNLPQNEAGSCSSMRKVNIE